MGHLVAVNRRFRPVELNNPAPTGTGRKGLLSIITIGLQGGTRFISNWLIGRLAGKVALGAVSSATALAFSLHTLWTSSSPAAASKFISRARGKDDAAELFAVTRHIGVRVIQAALLLASVAPALWVFLYDGAVWEGLCISVILLTVATSQFARGVHFGAGQVARGTKIDILTSVIGIGTTAAMLAFGVRDLTLTLPLSIAMGVYALLCWPWTAHGRPDRQLRGEIDKFVLFGALGSIASAGMLQISQLTAAGIGRHAAEINAPALQLVTPLSIIASAITMVLYPAMAEAQGAGDQERLSSQTNIATRVFVITLVPCFGAVAIASRPIIALIWGTAYAESATLMPVYALALLIYNVAAPSVGSITSGPHRHMWYSLLLSQAGLLSAIISWLLLVTPLGVFGVAVGYGIGACVTALGLVMTAWRMGQQRWGGLVGSLVGAMIVIALLSWWRQAQALDYWLDILVAAAFTIAWTILCWPQLQKLRKSRAAAGSPQEGNTTTPN